LEERRLDDGRATAKRGLSLIGALVSTNNDLAIVVAAAIGMLVVRRHGYWCFGCTKAVMGGAVWLLEAQAASAATLGTVGATAVAAVGKIVAAVLAVVAAAVAVALVSVVAVTVAAAVASAFVLAVVVVVVVVAA